MNLLDILLNEDLWFPAASGIAITALAGLLLACRSKGLSRTTILVCGLNLFYGVLIGVMGIGHLLAVSIKTMLDTLPASINPWFLYPLGLALAIPAWWLVCSVRGLSANRRSVWHRAVALNIILGAVLLPVAAPLAAPALLDIILLTWRRPT